MIEKKILRWSSVVILGVMIATFIFLHYYPMIQMSYSVVEDLEDESSPGTKQLANSKAPETVVENREELQGKLKMELPDDVAGPAVTVENHYLEQTVYVKFPTTCADYFSEYSLQGSSDTISSIGYYTEDGVGVMAIQMSRLYEVEHQFEKGSVYLTFVDPHDIYDKVIVVDAGHGTGAKGGATMAGVDEAELNLAIVLQLKKLLDASDLNIGVYYTRLNEWDVSLQDRARLANAAHADLFISVHNNAYQSDHWSYINGTSVLYSQSDNAEHNSKRFAELCLNHLLKELGSNRRGLVEGDSKYIIRTAECPVALVEIGYMTNRDEFNKLVTPEYQKKAARAIYNAMVQAFEEGF
ncbi:N-acetylmuramoyl-L-alanine amidase family protein [Agathobacter ruminis]|uniref:N-acetylmuramoyl-L-alanine amidase n=1 Tax=Agathobacter ruminis TaxID=1712665 RepID=A0A2G3E2N5_9FIRM|nr:N-acetylmuramoyl-L-alanine amidase [Agathobacter ruminis]MDC7300868.1 N-acetylmuramoyl-L-alanine amidase [Agathobacter ruminis]PHU37415.1 N-acetylmuramoyl-L-alanine amidase [Agathobacter ruminis]